MKKASKFMALLTATVMMASNIAPAFAAVSDYNYNYNDLAGDKAKIINENVDQVPIKIAKPKPNESSEDFVKEPAMPAIYTLRTDYKAEKGEKYSVNYQPYVASVGAGASKEEKDKVNKKIDLPNMAGYDKPKGVKSFTNAYDEIVKKAEKGHITGDEKTGYKYLALNEYKYPAKTSNVIVKHVFQDMDNFNVFTNPADPDNPANPNNKKPTITTYETKKVVEDGEEKDVKIGKVIEKDSDNKFDENKSTEYRLDDSNQKSTFLKFEKLTNLQGNTGSTLEVQPLQESQRPGFEPQIKKLKTQVPEDTSEFKIEYRYNRAAYNVVFDTKEGTPLPNRTYYFDQEIPKIDENSIPTKEGCEFLGWKPSHDLYGKDGTKYKKGEIIKDANGNALVDLGNTYYKRDGDKKLVLDNKGDPVKEKTNEIKLMMPALKLGNGGSIPREKLTFTAEWKDKEKADYAVQFWVEKADHADNASILEKYEYMSTRVYKQQDTGSTPDLDIESPGPVDDGQGQKLPGLPFPDLDKARLEKIWAGTKFNRDHDLYLNKFFVYNDKLTKDQNKDPKQLNITKAVSATGKTVYNIYYDRQVYDLYFTKSNALSNKETFYPEIWGYDPAKGKAVMLGGPGNLYHYKARFNEMMYKWPNDAKQTKGFSPGWQSYGWGPNYSVPTWPKHLDTPPYRLNAEEFLDMENYTSWGGYVKKIDKGDGTTIDLNWFDFKTLSFGIKQREASIPHHMDFWMDGFKDGETIIRYDLVRSKADTDQPTYGHSYPIVTGFTPRDYDPTNPQSAWPVIREDQQENGRVNEDEIDELNDVRDEITPNTSGTYYNNNGLKLPIGQLDFISAFYSNQDDFGDPIYGEAFTENGYLQFHYKRNKYPLRFNYDPTKIKSDSEFKYPVKGGDNKDANALETFYEFPLKCLSPDLVPNDAEREDKEYFKEEPANFLDNPNNLYKLGLYDLLQRDRNDSSKFFQDEDRNYRVKRPEGLSDQMVFKGWALDPAGKKMVWKNPKETMPFHALNLYAIWDEPDYKWKVTVDPNGGDLSSIDIDSLTKEKKTIKEGDIGKEEENTYPVEGYKDPSKTPDENKTISDAEKAKGLQVFTVVQKQQLKELPKPTRYGYDFLGWEVIRYTKDTSGNYTDKQDTSYRDRYKVPELYSFGTDVVSPIYLKAIWVENKRAEVKVRHYFLKREKTDDGEKLVLDTNKYPNPEPNSLDYKRVGDYVPTTGEKQDENWILATNDELMEKLHGTYKDDDGKEVELLPEYEKYNDRVKLNNTFFQSFRVEEDIKDPATGNISPNPENVFRFYYRPFRTRDYKVNYIDERGKKEIEDFFKGLDLIDIKALKEKPDYKNADDKGKEAILLEANNKNKAKFKAKRGELEKILDKYKIINKESVTSKCRHYDARNYRKIPGWKLEGKPQQQLFYDVNEDTNEFLGINGTGSSEIYFYYKDARVIEVNDPKSKVPDGYVRVTFKIDPKNKGGVFKDKDGKEKTELIYDVIKGLKSNNLPNPVIWEEGKKDAKGNQLVKEDGRYYITPDAGKAFKEWNDDSWLNKETELNKNYTFTAYFEWSGLTSSGLVRTEAYKDDKADATKDWSNKFAPTIEDLKKQLVWREKDEVKPIPAGTEIKLYDEAGNELTTDEQVYELVNEKKAADKDQLVRTVNIKAKVTFKDGKEPQELEIPITVYKNVYEALTGTEKPLFLSKAEKKPASEGGLQEILQDTEAKRYVKVTVAPTGDMSSKDNKVYYVNPKAWVEIPEVKPDGASRFTHWSADKDAQNENGVYDFAKRHKFTEDTVISPKLAEDVVEQTDPNNKPDVPKTYVKVIVKTTDKATDDTKFEKTFWVNPTKKVTIDVTNPTGKTVAADPAKPGTVGYKIDFFNWKSEETTPRIWKDKIVGKFENETTIVAKYSVEFEKIKDLTPNTDDVPTPQGKIPTVDEIKEKLTPPEGKTIKEVKIVKNPDVNNPGKSTAKVIVEYTDGSSVGTNDNPIEVPVVVHKNIIPEVTPGKKPEDALKNYVKVIFEADEGGKVSGDLVYYVSPDVEVDLTETAKNIKKTPYTGYKANVENWVNIADKKLKGTFTEKVSVFKFKFEKLDDFVKKEGNNTEKPEGYKTVKFKTDGNGKVDGQDEIIYFVNPKAGITLKVLKENEEATAKQIPVPTPQAKEKFAFKEWQEKIVENAKITEDKEYVAIFEAGKVTLTYKKGGDDVEGDLPADKTADIGSMVGLANKGNLAKPNATFAGWKLDGDEKIYPAGSQIKLDKARTATAQWTTNNHTVSFNTMGGSNVPSQEVVHGGKLQPVGKPSLNDQVFMGWKEKETDATYFDFATPITADKTLMAIWQDPVQKIDENATVEEQFIKVTFLKGSHGKLFFESNKKLDKVTYKVAKDYTFDQAQKAGMIVPGIASNNYYRVKDEVNGGWDKEAKLEGVDVSFTAQYDIYSDVIPIDPNITPDDKLETDKPEGMVLVTFNVTNPNKAFMTEPSKFYVKANTPVHIDTPVVHARDLGSEKNDYIFEKWYGFEPDQSGNVTFGTDTVVTDTPTLEKPDIRIRNPKPNARNVMINVLTDGATGYLEVHRKGKEPVVIEANLNVKPRRFIIPQELKGKLLKNDKIKVYSIKDGVKSEIREYRVR